MQKALLNLPSLIMRLLSSMLYSIKAIVRYSLYLVYVLIGSLDLVFGTFSCSNYFNPMAPLLAKHLPVSFGCVASLNMFSMLRMQLRDTRELRPKLALGSVFFFFFEAVYNDMIGKETLPPPSLAFVVLGYLYFAVHDSVLFSPLWKMVCIMGGRLYFSYLVATHLKKTFVRENSALILRNVPLGSGFGGDMLGKKEELMQESVPILIYNFFTTYNYHFE